MSHLVCLALLLPLFFFGCGSGSDGAAGAPGQDGQDGVSATAAANPESCVICHSGAGDAHQAAYDQYTDTSTLNASIVSVTSVDNGTAGFFNVTMVFDVTQNGAAYVDTGKDSSGNGFPTLDQETFYAVAYNNATRQFPMSIAFDRKTITHIANGQYSIIAKGSTFAPEQDNAAVYLYVVKGKLATEGMQLYSDVFNLGQGFGNVGTYVSAANVAGCEKCHGTPYMKHGYRAAAVSGLQDFVACKTCHYDTRNGGHQSWQLLVDNPKRYAELYELAKAAAAIKDSDHDSVEDNMTAAEKTNKYAYKANVMNDVHMSHAMEFAYPQSMSNCVTCHEGKLDAILTDANFTVATCKSCHPVTGGTDTGKVVVSSSGVTSTVYADNTVGLALSTILPPAIHGNMDLNTVQCTLCHAAGTGMPVFRDIHTGYEKTTYTATGQKYSSAFTVTIDNASFANNKLTFGFHATESPDLAGLAVTDIVPTVLVGLYGWDTKDYIVGPHVNHADGKRNLEAAVGTGTAHPRITTLSAAGGSWTVEADLSTWADKITNGTVKRVEIAVMPRLQADVVKWKNGTAKETLAINAPSRTFDLAANAFNDGFYKSIVKVAQGCNNCHEALGTTFHSGDRGGSIVVCRLCHTTQSGGSHLEMQSRSIDSYVHAIHSFQVFDIGDIDFTDPVEAMKYEHHIESTYPNFTIKNCKSCHEAGKFNVPDQSKSLPGLLSAADNTSAVGWNRNIGYVPSYFTGPASRACGGCHRAAAIKEDDASMIAAFNSHVRTNGCLVEYDAATTVLDTLIKEYMEYYSDGINLATP
jgi:hypothetical protein